MKILITHASAGAGHMKAAEAIYNGFKKYSEHDVMMCDVLDYTSPSFKKLYRGTYSFLVSTIPTLWAFCFGLIDIPWLQGFVRWIRRIYNGSNAKKFEAFLLSERFDYVIATHFMPTEITAALKRSGAIDSKLITVITDYDVHKIWLADDVHLYSVACDWTKKKMITLGVDEAKIFSTGIPSDEKFSSEHDIAVLKQKLKLKPDVFTVLIATGSFGIGPIEEVAKALNDFQIIVICGHNKGLYQRLSQQPKELVHVMGLVDNMHELMAVSDVMVTKPGGLSITEALVSDLPMIFFSPIPGQETNNIKVLNEYGIGFNSRRTEDIVNELERLRSSRDAFMTALRKTKRLAHPSAVKDILNVA